MVKFFDFPFFYSINEFLNQLINYSKLKHLFTSKLVCIDEEKLCFFKQFKTFFKFQFYHRTRRSAQRINRFK